MPSQISIPPRLRSGCSGSKGTRLTLSRNLPCTSPTNFGPASKPYSSSYRSVESCRCPLPESRNRSHLVRIRQPSIRVAHAVRPHALPAPGAHATFHICFPQQQSWFGPLASSIRGIAVRAKQQRDMKMLFPVVNAKRDLNHRIQTVDLVRAEVGLGIKSQSINARSEGVVLAWQWNAPSVLISVRRCQQAPIAVALPPFQPHRNIPGRLPLRDV